MRRGFIGNFTQRKCNNTAALIERVRRSLRSCRMPRLLTLGATLFWLGCAQLERASATTMRYELNPYESQADPAAMTVVGNRARFTVVSVHRHHVCE